MPIRAPVTPSRPVIKAIDPSHRRELVIGSQYLVQRDAHPARPATILDTRLNKGVREAYVSFVGQDKRLDAWFREDEIGSEVEGDNGGPSKRIKIEDTVINGDALAEASSAPAETSRRALEPSPSVESTPEREHATMTRVRNFEDVRFGEYLIKTWYYSPYPLPVDEHVSSHADSTSSPFTIASSSSSKKRKLPHSSSFPSIASALEMHTNGHANHAQSSQEALNRSLKSSRSVSDMLAGGVGKGGEGARGRLWACDLCFKYMRTRTGWDRHTSSCSMLQPPGRKVYQRGSYTIWEVDGANATLYCQNLSLFGKLFIDHKSVFFHVENFLFYVICDAATSRRDQVMAFFSKEKLSYDDYNLACIVTFPPFQNRGFGKLLIEFSYYLTKHPHTRPSTLSPGTPERPLSDLGLKGYTAYWVSAILRFFRELLASAEPFQAVVESPKKVQSPVKPVPSKEGRTLRVRKEAHVNGSGGTDAQKGEKVSSNDLEFVTTPVPGYKGQYSITISLSDIAKACHLRIDDTAFTLFELGFLQNRRPITSTLQSKRPRLTNPPSSSSSLALQHEAEEEERERERKRKEKEEELGEWKGVEVVISRAMVDCQWEKWRVREKGVLDESFVLL